jgi:hypothetical protein
MVTIHWDEAERLIIQQERWKKITRISLIFSAGLAAGIIIMLPFILNTKNALPGNLISKSISNQAPVSSTRISLPANPVKVNLNETVKTIEKVIQPEHLNKNNKRTITEHANTKINSITNAKNGSQHSILAAVSKNKKRQSLVNSNLDITASNNKLNQTPQNVEPVRQKQFDSSEQNIIGSNYTITQANMGENVNPPLVNNQNKDKNNSTINDIPNKNASIDQDKSPKIDSGSFTAKNNEYNYVKTKKDSSQPERPPLLRVTNFSKDTTSFSANILSVYAGANYALGWNNAGIKEANGITPWGGFLYTRNFNRKISASVGIGYSEINNLNKTYTSSTMQYDFGSATHIITLTPQSSYYIAIPLNFQYNFDRKDKASIGFDYVILLTNYCTLNTYQQTYFSETTLGSETENGYTQGFSNNDFQITLSYSRMLTNRLGIGLEGYIGLISVENSSFPGINEYGKNKGGRLFLSYQLMK